MPIVLDVWGESWTKFGCRAQAPTAQVLIDGVADTEGVRFFVLESKFVTNLTSSMILHVYDSV